MEADRAAIAGQGIAVVVAPTIVWKNIFEVLREDADFEEFYLDSTIVHAHQHASGAAKKKTPSFGYSRGGLTTKIHACVEGLGQLVRFYAAVGLASGFGLLMLVVFPFISLKYRVRK